MNFIEEIECFEQYDINDIIIYKSGNVPVLFTAAHTMMQYLEDRVKLSEPYTKAIALYLNKYANTHCLIKIKDTGVDSNRDNDDEFKNRLLRIVKDNDIKLVIDLHGANKEREFDLEFGTLNNLSADFSTIKELEEAFNENGLFNIVHNDPFKGGAITKSLFGIKEVDVIQLEINKDLRDINDVEKMKKLCDSLIKFVNQFVEYNNR